MQNSELSWDDLRLVLALARGGSLSGAAARLRIDHSTAYRRLNALEARLGVRVAERLRRGYALTAAGGEMLGAAERMEDTLMELERRLAGRGPQLEGTVRVSAPDDLVVALLTPILAGFQARHPAISIEVAAHNRLFSLSRREADVAVRPGRHHADDLIGRRIGALNGAVYAAPALAERCAGAQGPAGLGAAPWIGSDAGDSGHIYARFAARHLPAGAVVHRSNSLLAQAAAARAGIGLAALPCCLGDGDAGLRRVLPPQADLESELWLLTHRDLRTTARIRALMDHLHAALRAQSARLAGEADA